MKDIEELKNIKLPDSEKQADHDYWLSIIFRLLKLERMQRLILK